MKYRAIAMKALVSLRLVAVALALASCGLDLERGERGGSIFREAFREFGMASQSSRDATLRTWGWVEVKSLEGLSAVVSLPGRPQRPVVLYFYASWMGPGAEFESTVLGNESVKAKLEGYTLVYFDVTEDGWDIQTKMGAEMLPNVRVFESGTRLAASLELGETPVPLAVVNEVVSPDEFLRALSAGE